MTHDELRVDISVVKDMNNLLRKHMNAISEVIKLHEPRYWQNPNEPTWNGAVCTHCLTEQGDYESPVETVYPCPTIQAIEKELR